MPGTPSSTSPSDDAYPVGLRSPIPHERLRSPPSAAPSIAGDSLAALINLPFLISPKDSPGLPDLRGSRQPTVPHLTAVLLTAGSSAGVQKARRLWPGGERELQLGRREAVIRSSGDCGDPTGRRDVLCVRGVGSRLAPASEQGERQPASPRRARASGVQVR